MGLNSGYKGWSMSNRAFEAYENGEMPKSKWTKSMIIEKIKTIIKENEVGPHFKTNNLEKLTKLELFSLFMKKSSWHHTGAFFSKTEFYLVDEKSIANITDANIDSLISNRKPKTRKEQNKPLFVTALVNYQNWEGTRKHPKIIYYEEVVTYMSNEKMISTAVGNKRLSSINIIKKIEQKTKFASKDKLKEGEE